MFLRIFGEDITVFQHFIYFLQNRECYGCVLYVIGFEKIKIKVLGAEP